MFELQPIDIGAFVKGFGAGPEYLKVVVGKGSDYRRLKVLRASSVMEKSGYTEKMPFRQ